MHNARVISVVAVIRFDFHRRRKVWRKSVRAPLKMPADGDAEAVCDEVIVGSGFRSSHLTSKRWDLLLTAPRRSDFECPCACPPCPPAPFARSRATSAPAQTPGVTRTPDRHP